ncbi:MAG: hypothetical protein WAM69_00400, partial [Candidatus Sulfotelmatobacter sp.]
NYEGQIAQVRARPTCVKSSRPQIGCIGEGLKANMIGALTKDAAAAYSQIITRYPVMDREEDAKKRLAALHQPIPRPTKAAVARNGAEEDSRRETTTLVKLMSVVKKGPDVSQAAKVGEPSLVDPTPISANQVERDTIRETLAGPRGTHSLSVEAVAGGTPAANQPAPRSDTATTNAANAEPFARPNSTVPGDPNELKPSGPADANELTPLAGSQSVGPSDAALPPPTQINEIHQGQRSSNSSAAASSGSSLASDQDISSSRKKKKKGLRKFIPF